MIAIMYSINSILYAVYGGFLKWWYPKLSSKFFLVSLLSIGKPMVWCTHNLGNLHTYVYIYIYTYIHICVYHVYYIYSNSYVYLKR